MIEISKRVDLFQLNRTRSKLSRTIGKLVVKVDVDSKWNGKVLKCEAYVEIKKENVSDIKPIVVHCKE